MMSLVFALIMQVYLTGLDAIPQVPRGRSRCTPSQTRFDGCNWCTCASDGSTEICTERWCGQVEPMVCTPGQTRYDGCNWCTCTRNGRKEYCTERYCSRRHKRVVSGSSPALPSCLEGKHWYDGCNWCSSCDGDKATVACSKRTCGRRQKRFDHQKDNNIGCGGYAQGDIWFNGCSWCRCDNDVVRCRPSPDVCTITRCGEHDAGSVWQDGCSLCICLPDGGNLCTKDLCDTS